MDEHLSILIIDDNHDNILLIQALLKEENVRIEVAHSGEEGLAKVRELNPDLVLLDVFLPGMTGYEVCRAIKGDEIISQCMVVMLSSIRNTGDDISKGFETGADSYISRPVSNRELLARLKSFFRLIRTEKSLIKSEERLSLILKGTNDGWWDFDIVQNQVYFSPRYWEIMGYNANDKLPESEVWDKLTHPDDKSLINNTFEKAVENNETTFEFESRRLHKDGYWITVLTRGYITRDENGKPIRCSGTTTDITAIRESEKQLAESELYLRTLINGIPDVVCFKDGQGKWITSNEENLKLFNIQGVDYAGRKDTDFSEISPFFSEVFQKCEESDELAWLTGRPIRSDEAVPQPDGTDRIFDIIKIPTYTETGERKGIIVIGRDITDRKKTEIELNQKLIELERFNNLTVDREIKMIGLKKEINELLIQNGQEIKYHIPQ